MAIAGKVGSIYMKTTDVAATFTDEAMTNIDNATWRITDDAKRYWDKATAVTVTVDATPETGITIDYVGGRITFDTPLAGTETVLVSGKYWTVSELAGFYNWSLDIVADLEDSTTFADSGWRAYTPTLKGFNISAESFWQDDKFIDRLGEEVVVALYVNEASDYRYEGFSHIESDSISHPVDALIEESVTFTGDGELYYYEV
jgi:hypothetical protein